MSNILFILFCLSFAAFMLFILYCALGEVGVGLGLIIIFTIAIGGLDKPDRDTIRDCTIHKEIRDTAYCDGVVYEKGNK